MPELAASSLEARVERAVQAVITERRVELEQLLQARIDQEIQALAEGLVAAQLHASDNDAAGSVSTTRTPWVNRRAGR